MGYFFEGTTLSGGSGVGGDSANVSLSNLNSAGNGRFDAKASTALDNLSLAGQRIIDSANGTISNCILEIPQNIKLELSNNILRLKAGSVLTRTGSTYATETTATDLTYTITSSLGSGKFVIFGNSSGLATPRKINNIFSGNSSQYPTTDLTSTTVYFNTDDKLLYKPNNDLSGWNTWSSDYPFCVIDIDENNTASFAKDSNGRDMIFNGAGFIGHHAFVYPNVKSLIPNGFNSDGTLKSILVNTNALIIRELSNGSTLGKCFTSDGVDRWNGYIEVETYDDFLTQRSSYIVNTRFYVKELNKTFVDAGGSIGIIEQPRTPLVYYSQSNNIVTDFTIRQPYQGARCLLTDEIKEEVATKQVDVTTLTGYDATKTQTLKSVNGVLTWIDD